MWIRWIRIRKTEPIPIYVSLGGSLKKPRQVLKFCLPSTVLYPWEPVQCPTYDFFTIKKPKQNVSSNCVRSRGLVPVQYFQRKGRYIKNEQINLLQICADPTSFVRSWLIKSPSGSYPLNLTNFKWTWDCYKTFKAFFKEWVQDKLNSKKILLTDFHVKKSYPNTTLSVSSGSDRIRIHNTVPN